MRLTLRTLLAYLDNVLDPQDASDLAVKVEESQFASTLVERIQNCVRRSRLSAAPPVAETPHDDANLTAEYLDSQLSEDGVAQVERLCLESDVHLAEVAATHQVLALALQRPASVPPGLRERIYALTDSAARPAGTDADTAAPTRPAAGAAAAGATPRGGAGRGGEAGGDAAAPEATSEPAYAGAGPAERSLQVPDYLYERGWRRMNSVLVTALLCVVFLFALSQALKPLGRLSREEPELAGAASDRAEGDAAADRPGGGAADEAAERSAPADRSGAAGEERATERREPQRRAREPQRDAREREPSGAAAAPRRPVEPTEEADASDEPAGLDELAVPPVVDGDAGRSPAPNTPPPPRPADASLEMDDRERPDAPVADAGEADAGDDEDAAVGRVAGEEGLLLAFDPEERTWERVEAEASVPGAWPLMNAPLYRSQLQLDGGVELEIIDAGRLRVLPGRQDTAIELDVEYGQGVVLATAPETRVGCRLADRAGVLVLDDLESVVAYQATHARPPGFDPAEPDVSQPVGMLLAVQGTVRWEPEDGEAEELTTGEQLRWIGEVEAERVALQEIPAWIDPEDPRLMTIDTSSRRGLLPLVPAGEPADAALREATLFRQSDVAALAARTLLHLERPDIYFGVDGILNRPDQRAYWPNHVAELLNAVGRGPQSAERVRGAIERMSGAEADTLYRLLWGFHNGQLEEGADAELVELLDSPLMSARVLAMENLRQITGQTLSYRADHETSSRRAAAVKKWQSRLRRGDIRWAEPPELPSGPEASPADEAPPADVEEPADVVEVEAEQREAREPDAAEPRTVEPNAEEPDAEESDAPSAGDPAGDASDRSAAED